MPDSEASRFAIFGSGGFGREVAWLARSDPSERRTPVCFVDDGASGDGASEDEEREAKSTDVVPSEGSDLSISRLPVLSLERFTEHHADTPLVIAIGRPDIRRAIANRLTAGALRSTTLVHDGVRLSPSVVIGEGSIVCEGALLTVDITLGRHVHVNLGCTIGHDSHIGDFTTLSPGVHVSGHVTIEPDVFIGTGAVILNGRSDAPLVIGAGSVIGAGAVVMKGTEPGGLYVGVPARLARARGASG